MSLTKQPQTNVKEEITIKMKLNCLKRLLETAASVLFVIRFKNIRLYWKSKAFWQSWRINGRSNAHAVGWIRNEVF